jgi:hypothetical protein
MRATDLVNQFDFARVHKVMTVLDWTWAGDGVPGVVSMVETAHRLLEDLEESKRDVTSISTGGFRASRYKDSDTKRWVYTLEFIAASMSTEEYG